MSPNKVLPLVSSLSTSTWIFLLLFYLLISGIRKFSKAILNFVCLGSAFASIYILLMYSGFIPLNVNTPLGNLLTAAIFLFIVLIYLVFATSLSFFKNGLSLASSFSNNLVRLLSAAVILAALLLLLFHLTGNQKPLLLPNSIGMGILKKTIAYPKNLLLGAGPGNFISAFTLYKPGSINSTPLWNITFASSSSFFINLVTETGIFSGIGYLILIFMVFNKMLKSLTAATYEDFPILLSLLILLLLLLFLPASTALLILTVSLLGLTTKDENRKYVSLEKLGKMILILPVLGLMASGLVSFFTWKIFIAEYYYNLAVGALNKSNLDVVYNLEKQAITQNPYLDKYHLAISQSSLLIADALLNKENKTEDDNQKIPRLISQAISEGKISVDLNSTNVQNLANLTTIYSSLISFAPGADSWAEDLGNKTILLDPSNPNHYLTLAGIYRKSKKNAEAEKSIAAALKLKPDLNVPENIKHQQE